MQILANYVFKKRNAWLKLMYGVVEKCSHLNASWCVLLLPLRRVITRLVLAYAGRRLVVGKMVSLRQILFPSDTNRGGFQNVSDWNDTLAWPLAF